MTPEFFNNLILHCIFQKFDPRAYCNWLVQSGLMVRAEVLEEDGDDITLLLQPHRAVEEININLDFGDFDG